MLLPRTAPSQVITPSSYWHAPVPQDNEPGT